MYGITGILIILAGCVLRIQGECPQPRPPINGYFSGGYSGGSTLMYACTEGFHLQGLKENFCLRSPPNEYWAFEVPLCEANRCGNPPEADSEYGCYGNDEWCRGTTDSDYRQREYEANDSVPYICTPGYGIAGTSATTLTVSCQVDGTWSQKDIRCSEIRCHVPSPKAGEAPIVKHKYDDAWSDQSFRELDDVIVSCPPDTVRVGGHEMLTCGRGGVWSGDFPQCKAPYSTVNVDFVTCAREDVCYSFYNRNMEFYDAKTLCENNDAQLVTIPNKATNDWLVDQLSSLSSWDSKDVWIGLKYDGSQWVWLQGDRQVPLSHSDFDNTPYVWFESYGHCRYMDTHGSWVKTYCNIRYSNKRRVVCEHCKDCGMAHP